MCIIKYSDTVNIENAEYVPKKCLFAIINVDTNNAGESLSVRLSVDIFLAEGPTI